MNISETLKYFRHQQKQAGELLLDAVWKSNKKNNYMHQMLICANPLYLVAVNTRARIKWGTLLIRELFEFFKIKDSDGDPEGRVFFVTLADRSLITSVQPQKIGLEQFKRKLAGRMRGLNYIGMIEPAYYYNAFDATGQKTSSLVSWHGHFLVWGISRRRLSRTIKKLNGKLTAVMPEFAAAHWKQVEIGKFGQKICYLAKSPRKEYSVGKYRDPKKNGEPHYKHNSREIRPGTRVKLFHLLRHMYLDQLSMAGGRGVQILQRIKSAALWGYRCRHGWSTRRP
jgi:hypothetical protein